MRALILCGYFLAGVMACAVTPASARHGLPPMRNAPQTAAPNGGSADIVDIDAIVVSGVQPGPGLWKVSKGGHVLYILGTVRPLPRQMQWASAGVEATIARAQAVIEPPSAGFDADLGFFGTLGLLPSALRARKNPDGRTLQQSVSPALYARWQVLKARYIGSDRGVERMRPMVAAQQLYDAAIRRAGLSQRDIVTGVVESAAKRNAVPMVSTRVTFRIEDPKAALREYNDTALADTECFGRMLDLVDTELDALRARANAWAVGDVAALRSRPIETRHVACTQATSSSAVFRKRGLGDMGAQMDAAWLAAADQALARHRVSFATLGAAALLGDDGILVRLRARGYAIEEPSMVTEPAANPSRVDVPGDPALQRKASAKP